MSPTAIARLYGAGVAAKPGYSLFHIPWLGVKTTSGGAWIRGQASGYLQGGYFQSSSAQNDEYTTDLWFDAGTYKFALLHGLAPSCGIYSVQLDGVEKGTIDGYGASGVPNTYNEITGVAITAGLKVFKMKMATKNASSTFYNAVIQSTAWIRTGA